MRDGDALQWLDGVDAPYRVHGNDTTTPVVHEKTSFDEIIHGEGRLQEVLTVGQCARAPARVVRASWGSIELDNGTTYRDLVVCASGAKEWDWREYRMHHVPGVTALVLERLLSEGASTIVIGCGYDGALAVSEEARRFLRAMPPTIEVIVRTTPAAISLYNARVRLGNWAVAGLFHSTC